MKINPLHHRKSIRLPGYDYTHPGPYFVTTVTWHRECLFGKIESGEMKLNDFGKIVADTWEWLASQYPYVELGAWCVMPNHFHGIITIDGRDALRRISTTIDSPYDPTNINIKPLGQLIGAFKTVSAKQINILRNSSGAPVWQRNFDEQIIRDENEMQRIHTYIELNPLNWEKDKENQ